MTYTAQNIRYLRKTSGLKQVEIASRLGFVRNTWSNWENGISEPDLGKLQIIAAHFKVDISDIVSTDMAAGGAMAVTERSYPRYERQEQYAQEAAGGYNNEHTADIIQQQAVTIRALQTALIAAQREIDELKGQAHK